MTPIALFDKNQNVPAHCFKNVLWFQFSIVDKTHGQSNLRLNINEQRSQHSAWTERITYPSGIRDVRVLRTPSQSSGHS